MVTEQETLIYIEDQDKKDASIAANAFAHKDTKNRAYINTLGADLALKYLASENIDVSDVYNIHSIKKILEEFDISDIMLPNIHIDVRVVFDENVIFIPKSHFEYNIEPDIYLVFNLAKDFSHVKFLGFFEPRLINKNNANDKYYFIEKEKLNSVVDLKKYIESHKGNTKETLSQEDIENSERIIISMSDNDISENDKKFLIKQLTKSAELRDKFIEYENFETLSYKAMTEPQITRKEIVDSESTNISDTSILDEIENTNNTQVDKNLNEENNKETSENIEGLGNENLTSINEVAELNLEPIEDIENISFEDNPNNENNSSSTIDNTNTNLENIGNTIIEGIADSATAAGAEEIINAASTADAALNIADTALNIVDTGIEITKDIINNNETTGTESISFENISTSEIDNINTFEENTNNETMSLNDIEIPEQKENTDFINDIDNKISFDNVEINEKLDEPNPLNFDDETMSLNDIEIPEQKENTDFINDIDNKISFDNVEINEKLDEPNSLNFDDETTSFDNLTSTDIQDENSFEENSIDQNTDDFMDSTFSLDDIPTETNNLSEELNFNNEIGIDDNPSTTDINTEIEPQIIEETEQTTSQNDSFGKNLLEHLSSDEIDDISIENLGIDENIPHDNEDISSNDLLSQIDDVLNSTPVKENYNNEIEQQNEIEGIESQENETLFEDIPDISDLTTISEIENTLNNNYNNNVDTLESGNQIPEETEAGLLKKENFNKNDELLDNNREDTTIDDLLNFDDDNSSEELNSSDEDNIGVLFNDTDPTSDVELDEINDNNQEIQQPQIPGAALLNNKNKMPNKKVILVAAALVTVLVAASAMMILKPKNNDNNSTANIETIPTTSSKNEEISNNNNQQTEETTENILATNAPVINKSDIKNVQKSQPATELKNNQTSKPKQNNSESYLSVNKLVWDVPANLSYSSKFQNYLRTAGKSIKLSLSADLLLATEYSYTNQIKVNLQLNQNGSVQDAKIISSSGSTQIDNIVLQSVKDTLNVVKPPVDEIKTPNYNLSLIIYF